MDVASWSGIGLWAAYIFKYLFSGLCFLIHLFTYYLFIHLLIYLTGIYCVSPVCQELSRTPRIYR